MDHYSNLPHSALYYEWNVYKHLLSNSLLAFTWTANVLPYLCKHLNVLHNCLHNTKSFASHHQLSQRFPPAITSLVWMSTRKAGDIRSEWQGRCVCPIVGSESSAHKSQFKRSSVPAIDFACWLGTMAISAILVPGHTQVLECQRGPWADLPCLPSEDRGGRLNTDLGQTSAEATDA